MDYKQIVKQKGTETPVNWHWRCLSDLYLDPWWPRPRRPPATWHRARPGSAASSAWTARAWRRWCGAARGGPGQARSRCPCRTRRSGYPSATHNTFFTISYLAEKCASCRFPPNRGKPVGKLKCHPRGLARQRA